jgi:hypothetical protein
VVGSGFIDISNKVGLVKSVLFCFISFAHTPLQLCSLVVFLTGDAPQFASSCPGPTQELGRVTSSTRCCPPDISPITYDHDDLFELPAIGEAGSLFTYPVTAAQDHC